MSEFMGLIQGSYDGKKGGFLPGGKRYHWQPVWKKSNCPAHLCMDNKLLLAEAGATRQS